VPAVRLPRVELRGWLRVLAEALLELVVQRASLAGLVRPAIPLAVQQLSRAELDLGTRLVVQSPGPAVRAAQQALAVQ
jgi:hypothetical protein